ncbi:MAG TPA: hypothetical protein VMD99_16075 [Terriglobales bacterium]|nr:hypothetical protein [Terriglobales bacterium]
MPFSRKLPKILLLGAVALIVPSIFLAYVQRFDRPVLYYYGAAPVVPHGSAIAILNPFRGRKDEANAEWLIRDLRTSRCEQIVGERLRADPSRICPILQASTKARLIWLDAERKGNTWAQSRQLFYDLPESHSRLVVSFANSEAGWGVDTISLIR